MSAADLNRFFDSLHFYYDYGCGRAASFCKEEGGVLLRWLYDGLLPCMVTPQRMTLGDCVRAHFSFRPPWAERVIADGFAEVSHRAVGFAVGREARLARTRNDTNPASNDGADLVDPLHHNASRFMDAGVAGMWYSFQRGSGVFYKVGRCLARPGKTAMAAALLRELVGKKKLAALWPELAKRDQLFVAGAMSKSARIDADRLQAVANGSSSCVEAGIQSCRCRYVLHDQWDNVIIWMARALNYDSLLFTATLLCNQPSPSALNGIRTPAAYGRGGFSTAYPEIVDVRPFDAAMQDRQYEGKHDAYVLIQAGGELRAARKHPEVAAAWLQQIRDAKLLTLRDPFDLAREWAPCHFSEQQSTLQCNGHVSSRWPASAWSKCGVIGCGYHHGGARAIARLINSRNATTSTSA